MAVKSSSISMDERAWRQARAAAQRAGLSTSAWLARAAREKLQRDAAVQVAALDQACGNDWADWAEAREHDLESPDSGHGAA